MKHSNVRIFLLLLVSLLVLLAGCNGETSSTTGTTATTGTTVTTEPPIIRPNEPDPDAEYAVSVVNGMIEGGVNSGVYRYGTTLTLEAAKPAKGYVFSHWENAAHTSVGNESTLEVTVFGEDTYKAYYTVEFGASVSTEQVILTDLEKDWQQGGINGGLNAFNKNDKSRISFVTPYFLRTGETISVAIPNDTYLECPYAVDNDESTVACEGGCAIAIAKQFLKKNEGSNTGDLFTDYSFATKASWCYGGFEYTATSDIYVMITVKYHKHGNLAFNIEKEIMQDMVVTVTTKATDSESDNRIGNYWVHEIEDSIQKIETNREQIGAGVSEFFFITDVHWKDFNAQYSPAMINYLAEKLDSYFVVFGGDVIELNDTRLGAINDEVLDFFHALDGYTKAGEQLKILSTLGNHDRNFLTRNPDQATILTDRDVYNLFVARTEGWAVTLDDNPYCSYYDDTENKVRYLQFSYASNTVNNPGDKFDAVLNWSEQQIKALDGDWTVILISHGIFGGNNDERMDAVKERVLKWQAEADAEIALWVTGHTHADYNEIFVSADGKTAIRAISLIGDSYGKQGTYTEDMVYGTVTEQSFAYLQIDKNTQTIRVTRIGAGKDLVLTYGEAMEGEYDTTPSHAIRVVNGSVNGVYYTRVKDGEMIRLEADRAPAGYAFSCWKDLDGNVVGTTMSLTIAADKSTQYKPYYIDTDPSNDITDTNAVKTDLANDWMHGGLSNMPVEWWLDGSLRDTRACFAEPILLKKGQTITVSFPTIECPKGGCANGCKLVSLIAVMDKTGETDTGYLPLEYTVTYSQWRSSYTATKDCYVMVMVKYDKHGDLNFSSASEEMQGVVVTVNP